MPEEDRATDIGNMHKKCGKDLACGSGDILADRHTDSSQYFATAPAGEVSKNKCVSRLARCIPYHMALHNAAAPNSESPCHAATQFICRNQSYRNLCRRRHVTPREPMFTKWEKTCPDSRPTCMQNFTPLAFSAAEKSITVQRNNKMTNKKITVN